MAKELFKEARSYIIATVGILFLLIALFGNTLVIVAVYKKRYLRSTTNYLLLNLAISDIISTVLLIPIAIGNAFPPEEGILGDVLCKFIISYHVPLTASFSSILTLTILAVERYHAVVKPMVDGLRLRDEHVRYAIAGVWVSVFTVSSPIYYSSSLGGDDECVFDVPEANKKAYLKTLMSLAVFVPFCIICFCYSGIIRELYFKGSTVSPPAVSVQQINREKRQLFKVSILVTTAFVVCYLPMAVTLFMWAGSKYYKYASILYFIEAAFNPIVYASQSSNFQRAFKELLPCFSRS